LFRHVRAILDFDWLMLKADWFMALTCQNMYGLCPHQNPDLIQGGPKVSTHTLGLIAQPCSTFEGCCFADGILYLLVRGFRRQNLKIRISKTTPIQN